MGPESADGPRAILEAGNEPLDAELAILADRDARTHGVPRHAPRQNALVGPRVDAEFTLERQATFRLAVVINDPAGDRSPGLETNRERTGLVSLQVD